MNRYTNNCHLWKDTDGDNLHCSARIKGGDISLDGRPRSRIVLSRMQSKQLFIYEVESTKYKRRDVTNKTTFKGSNAKREFYEITPHKYICIYI